MGFRQLDIKSEYRSLTDNVVTDFYIPSLEQAVLYKRSVGFFSSTALIEMTRGICGLVKNSGRIMIIASPRLQQEDIDAINKGYEERTSVIQRALVNAITEPRNYFEEKRLNLLANLIADGVLDIRIAFTETNGNIGIYHEKMGLLYDEEGNIIAFSGSMNETATAFMHNYETIDVYCSWTHDNARVQAKDAAFNKLWNNCEPNLSVVEFPKVAIEKLQAYKTGQIDLEIDVVEFAVNRHVSPPKGPCIPKEVSLFDYQIQAVEEWAKRGFIGIFDMATGTGKTYTGLAAITRLFEHCDKQLAVLIVCPYQHLVEQWVEDIKLFNMKPIVGYSTSQQRNWKTRLKDEVSSFNLGVREHFCFVTTNATFSSEFVRAQVELLEGNVLLVVDEAHNFGASHLSTALSPKIPYRLALSATIERYGDEEGTEKLYNYFGEKCIEYSLERAIWEGKLTPYYYYPVVIHLDNEELDEYRAITKEVIKHCSTDAKGKLKISQYGKLLLIKRARLVAAAKEKIKKLQEIMVDYRKDKHLLVYCGAATMREPGYKEGVIEDFEMRQIDVVSDLLGNKLGMGISQFTSTESASERERLKKEFAEGDKIQALVAIRCLDEGVNIPNIKTAFLLASSTNPKEYIQRRGRVLRKFPGKHYATIYDFITLPRKLDNVQFISEDEWKMDLSLIKREITRIRDFADLAQNPAQSDFLISAIEEAYGFIINKYRRH
jgi:superfamily II DNA or RNA helicase